MAIADITYLDYQIPFFFEWKPETKYKICRKGRRAGITKGAANAVIEWLLDGNEVLWGETTHGNIERYFERYFLPVLKENQIRFRFDKQKKQLNIGKAFCDFRSEDNPENWEGFAYKFIFLNEAGIILKNRDLYVNSVLPMLLDFPDSKLIAAGVPKGKILKDGTEHPFYTLYKRAEEGNRHYEHLALSSYDNPLLSESDIKDLEIEIELFSPEQVRQEIYGEFIESDALNPFASSYDPDRHESKEAVFQQGKQIIIMMDFNRNPFAVTFNHVWRDEKGRHDHQFDEMAIKNGSVPEMIDRVKERYGPWLHGALLSGDAMGKRGQLSERDYASIYQQLLRGFGMNVKQLRVSGNPTHENSRADVNFVLYHHPDFKVNPEKCPNTCRDYRVVQCDAYGQIVKANRNDANQRADHSDCFVGDTLIETEAGQRQISDIQINELVLTRGGYKKVIDKWGSMAEVYEVEFEDGNKIKCTKDHKFYTHEYGFYSIYSIFEENISIWKLPKQLNITEEITGSIRNKNIIMSVGKAKDIADAFIGRFGLIITERFQKAWQFIIKTMTLSITQLKTWNLKNEANTKETTWYRGLKTIQIFLKSFRRQELRLLPYGTQAQKARRGIAKMQFAMDSAQGRLSPMNVQDVKSHSKANPQEQSFAPTNVNQQIESLKNLTSLMRFAISAEMYSKKINTQSIGLAEENAPEKLDMKPVKVKGFKKLGMRKVYDITIEDKPEFFANGILVHNCCRYKVENFHKDFIREFSLNRKK